MDDQHDSARTSLSRRLRTALVGIALALGLLIPASAAMAGPVPAQPAPQAPVTSTAGEADGEAEPADVGTTAGSTAAGGSLSRKKTIAALILGFLVALLAAVFALRRSAADNRLG